MLEFLRDSVWQGIGAIAGLISVVISLWQVKQTRTSNSSTGVGTSPQQNNTSQRIILAFFSLFMPIYAIFVGSILLVNTIVKNSDQITYGAVFVATVLALFWGIVWANFIQKAFKPPANRRSNNKLKRNEG